MFRKYGVTVVCGNGIGKTNAAIGKGIKALADGKTVTLIQFLKGKANSDLMQVLKKLLAVRPEEMQLIITGKVFPEELKDCVDLVSRIETIYRKN